MQKIILILAFALFFIRSSPAQVTKNNKARRPNIIFILADDLGYGDIGVNGQKLIKTPNIDKLAKQGVRFTQFYAGTSVCAPSRSSLLTGKHTGHTYIRGNKGVDPEGQEPIADSVLTVAEVLQKAGYQTAAFGKWGLGPVGSVGDPNKQGFDQFFGYNCQTLAHRYYPNHLWENGKKIILEANQNLRENKEYAPDIIQQKALDFVDHREKDKPFFLFLPYILPHAELLVPNDSIFEYYKSKSAEKPYKGNDYGVKATKGGYTSQEYPHAAFAAMVSRLDLYVGQILDKLKQEGLDKNTLVIFTSDNGPHKEGGADPDFFNSGGGFKGYKRDLYEGGIREPFIARWTNVIKPNSQNNHIGAFWDLLPTFSELAGVKVAKNIDGLSFAPTLKGNKAQQKHAYLYWEFHENGGVQAVRQGNWKAVKLNASVNPKGAIELYDLAKDPKESKNLAKQYPDKVKELSKLINESHVESTLFPFLKQNK
ncbi:MULTISPECIES: arylsulfatase [unclassified Arcicella]|uniref:arylsulfatase n=1 Tax=unclassified Arcicella TaxID=2644986 RepID=UPI0028640FB4|nr:MULTISPECIES: arylsulfatase [unclassified Arcicella]MDR6562043.1 arylsulfatase A-like enzyme [Arcicella sp. BE51]MDR6811915.1 arylsulfatase A-like enzyme [Arcicella sp. BE140]MDR6822945.1 arylsulfatase A-like enzyme [Arcicella sp. BE139]